MQYQGFELRDYGGNMGSTRDRMELSYSGFVQRDERMSSAEHRTEGSAVDRWANTRTRSRWDSDPATTRYPAMTRYPTPPPHGNMASDFIASTPPRNTRSSSTSPLERTPGYQTPAAERSRPDRGTLFADSTTKLGSSWLSSNDFLSSRTPALGRPASYSESVPLNLDVSRYGRADRFRREAAETEQVAQRGLGVRYRDDGMYSPGPSERSAHDIPPSSPGSPTRQTGLFSYMHDIDRRSVSNPTLPEAQDVAGFPSFPRQKGSPTTMRDMSLFSEREGAAGRDDKLPTYPESPSVRNDGGRSDPRAVAPTSSTPTPEPLPRAANGFNGAGKAFAGSLRQYETFAFSERRGNDAPETGGSWWNDLASRRRLQDTQTPGRGGNAFAGFNGSAADADADSGDNMVPVTPPTTREGPIQWQQVFDPVTGRYFYHNPASKISIWERPRPPAVVVAYQPTPAADARTPVRNEGHPKSTPPSTSDWRFLNDATNAETPTRTPPFISTTPKYPTTPSSMGRSSRLNDFSRTPTRRRSPSMDTSASSSLIAPQAAEDKDKYVIVLDLDETLVYAREGPLTIRPGARELMRLLAGQCEVIVWTAGERAYAHIVIQELDPDGVIVKHCVYRHPKWFTGQQGQVKDLRLLRRDMNKTLIVENTPDCVRLNPYNAAVVPDYMGARQDDTLLALCVVIRLLFASRQTVPEFLKSTPLATPSAVRTDFGDSITVFAIGDVNSLPSRDSRSPRTRPLT
ncbi:putative phosphatase PSR2 [Diplonema papillatum]|nr:putative phosphatase PSR2 [Diplonema papillatum]